MEHKKKKLKFKRFLIQEILSGRKTTTWRFFDDKDLKKGDFLEFFDYESDEYVIDARVLEITEKKLKEINDKDYEGHEKFLNDEEMLQTYKKYYGDNISWNTPLKVVKFKLV